MAKVTDYLVYRHGSNAANQGMRDVAPLEIVSAESREKACEQMAARTTVYANQHLRAVPVSRARAGDVREVEEENARWGQS
jgi:hypothetical protein